MKRFALLATTIGLMLSVSACGRFDCGFGEEWGPMMNFGHGGMFMGMIFLIVLVAVAIWWFTRGACSKNEGRLPGENPLDILKKRYARGEITKEEFEKIRKDIEG
jgi:putative membrane protein